MGRSPLRLALPTPEEVRSTAIHFLTEGNEEEEARLLASCWLELGEVRLADGCARQIDITLRCKRKVLERLESLAGNGEQPKAMVRIRRAVNLALPSGYEVGHMDARAAGPRIPLPDDVRPPPPEIRPDPAPESAPAKESSADPRGPGYVFERVGSSWRVVFGGGTSFRLGDTLGARYLNHLLHQPDQAIAAYDLEGVVRPERAQVRPRNSVQRQQDPKAVAEYLRELERVRALLEAARDTGNQVEQNDLEAELESLEAQLKGRACAADAGERARNNVRKALSAIRFGLKKGNRHERAFSEHIDKTISLGFQCIYHQPPGITWE